MSLPEYGRRSQGLAVPGTVLAARADWTCDRAGFVCARVLRDVARGRGHRRPAAAGVRPACAARLAALAGLSILPVRLEQGRSVNPSSQVTSSLARARADRAEPHHLYRLADTPRPART